VRARGFIGGGRIQYGEGRFAWAIRLSFGEVLPGINVGQASAGECRGKEGLHFSWRVSGVKKKGR